jgi:hypothetical protein
VDVGGLTGASRDRAWGLGFARGSHQDEAREAKNSSRAARLARTWRRRCRARRGGAARWSNSGELSSATQGTGTTTSGTGGLLTSLRDSGVASR